MNIKKIISQLFLLALLISNISIDTHASVPSKINVYDNQSLDGGIKLTWYKISDATRYIVKRAEKRKGTYTVIADNILENTYQDTGLENSKFYYYKVIAQNEEGLGIESDIVAAAPSKSNYIWFDIYGLQCDLCGIDIYDINDNKIYYSTHYISDSTISIPSSSDYATGMAYRLRDHNRVPFNTNDKWKGNTAPVARAGFKLSPHNGIKKIVIHAGEFSPIKTYIFETMSPSVNSEKVYYKLELNYEIRGNTIEYIVNKSGLKAIGQNEKIFLKWDNIENIKNYIIKRSENKNGPFSILTTITNSNEYVDKNLENQKIYYYKVECVTNNQNIIDLGTINAKTTKDRYIILELYESYGKNYYDDFGINELQILDSNNNVINYGVADSAKFDLPINYYGNIINSLGRDYEDFKLAQDKNLENYVLLGYKFLQGEWKRYALKLDENIGVDKINLWTSDHKQPKKVTFYKSLSYDYINNLKNRRNDNLSFFAEKQIADTEELIKYEFTQTSPNTPQGVNAISQDTKVNIKWNKVDNADSYKIKRSTSQSGPYTVIQEDIVDLQYTDTGVINGTEYYYVVSAVNKGGESNNSLEASVIPSAKLPQAPTGLTAKSQQNGINLSWNPIYNASSYTIKRSETAGGPYETILENTTDTSFSDSGLTFGTTYYYVITANNTIGISNNSEEVQGTPGQVLPEKPINIITKVKENNVYLTWDTANHAVSYNVMRSETEEGTYTVIENVKGISYKDVTAESDKIYFYKIIAVNEQGESEASEQVRVVVKDNIEQKILLSLTMKNGSTKEYVITHSQLVKFMSWYQDNTIKKGLPYFTLIAKNKYGAYKSSKKYILFDSIMAIDVKEVQSN
ncbi:hypothetical protein AN1V17_19880 [Vallitalea sediminicola]